MRSRALPLVLALLLPACERGCARSWFEDRGVGDPGPWRGGLGPPMAMDCPDGLARCSGGMVEASRLATVPLPCAGSPEKCTCPWDRVAECTYGCVAEEATVVLEKEAAVVQLCAPAPDAGPLVRPLSQPAECDDATLYRCTGGAVVSCAEHSVVGTCVRGCAHEGADISLDESVTREQAFALLCSR